MGVRADATSDSCSLVECHTYVRPDLAALQAQSMLVPYLRQKTNMPCMNIPAGKSQSACRVEDAHARTRSRTETPESGGKVCCEAALHSKDDRARRTLHFLRTLAQGTRRRTNYSPAAALTALVSGNSRHALVIQYEEAQRERHDSGAETGKITQPRTLKAMQQQQDCFT